MEMGCVPANCRKMSTPRNQSLELCPRSRTHTHADTVVSALSILLFCPQIPEEEQPNISYTQGRLGVT
jgi:hypothetical protein